MVWRESRVGGANGVLAGFQVFAHVNTHPSPPDLIVLGSKPYKPRTKNTHQIRKRKISKEDGTYASHFRSFFRFWICEEVCTRRCQRVHTYRELNAPRVSYFSYLVSYLNIPFNCRCIKWGTSLTVRDMFRTSHLRSFKCTELRTWTPNNFQCQIPLMQS